MDGKGQFSVFCLCVVVGFVGGFLYELFVLLRAVFRCGRGKNKLVEVLLDVAFFVSFAGLCTYAAYRFRFPDLRFYMWIGYAAGWIIYLKTLRRIVAFLENMCYNLSYKIIMKAKARKNSLNRGMDI